MTVPVEAGASHGVRGGGELPLALVSGGLFCAQGGAMLKLCQLDPLT